MDNLKYIKDMGDDRTYLVMHLADALEILNSRGTLEGNIDNPVVVFPLPALKEAVNKISLALQTIQELQFSSIEIPLDDEDNDEA